MVAILRALATKNSRQTGGMNLVANVEPNGKTENYQLTNKGRQLLQQLIEAGAYA